MRARLPTVVMVLRCAPELSTGAFRSEHVWALCEQIGRHWPEWATLRRVVLADTAAVYRPGLVEQWVPLQHAWHGWWSKLEMCRPDLDYLGTILYFDLDTVIVRSLAPLVSHRGDIMLSDFYRPEHLASGMMQLTARARARIWARWQEQPWHWMRHYRGDQDFIASCFADVPWPQRPLRWQTVVPGRVVSYKAHVQPIGVVPHTASVVCFHGPPRPWELPEERRLVVL